MTDSEHGGDSSDFTPFWESIFKKYLLNGEPIVRTFYFLQISTNCTYQIPGFLVQTDKSFLLDIRLTIYFHKILKDLYNSFQTLNFASFLFQSVKSIDHCLEGLNGVYRQLSNGLKINRQPSKKLFFSVNHQKCRSRLTVKKFQSISNLKSHHFTG